ncbi:hypothetical protein UFOVP56_57 [uncultured Caudovirales phage]|uniref:Uncharacterized protein n=1 Tax=uncultured Caudovirales phage TaxID=2100421 RepID=A0A6J5T8P7_9CAUD|nr:hypothetical protein UFOVP56_57 [uncultured Caudovirales phage]
MNLQDLKAAAIAAKRPGDNWLKDVQWAVTEEHNECWATGITHPIDGTCDFQTGE